MKCYINVTETVFRKIKYFVFVYTVLYILFIINSNQASSSDFNFKRE